ncbi:hypothetical protein [Terrisporobacter petrolearius]|uniref:hypothetical protein n=1 Tax=Terrisporobacter petrolearius TaxID=1460447 RepID=UPI001F22C14E
MDNFYKENDEKIIIDTHINYLDEVVTLKEATKLISESEITLKEYIKSGKLKEGIDCKKSGETWLILKSSLYKL